MAKMKVSKQSIGAASFKTKNYLENALKPS